MNDLVKHEVLLRPGYICMTKEPRKLYTVVGAGIVITIYDTKLKYGGMNHYIRPIREKPFHSTPIYACPAIIGLLEMLLRNGSSIEDLEAHVYGGASNPESENYVEGLSEKNIKVCFEILDMKNIRIKGKDIGGYRGRKVVFNTETGESIIAKVDKIRREDWYPEVADFKTGNFDF